MTDSIENRSPISKAMDKLFRYVEQTTGKAPSDEEVASALTRYFVLKEIADFIVMERGEISEK